MPPRCCFRFRLELLKLQGQQLGFNYLERAVSANSPGYQRQLLVQFVRVSWLCIDTYSSTSAATLTLKRTLTTRRLSHLQETPLETHLSRYAALEQRVASTLLTMHQGYTAVGGTNWIDEITVKYNKSLVLTYNYAYGGATIDASLVAPYESTVLSMTDQVNDFLGSAATKPASTPWTTANSMFSFWIGINDIGNSYYLGGDRDAYVNPRICVFLLGAEVHPRRFSDTLLDAYFALVEKLVSVIYYRIVRTWADNLVSCSSKPTKAPMPQRPVLTNDFAALSEPGTSSSSTCRPLTVLPL